MIKNIAVIKIEKNGKEFEIQVRDPSSWTEIFEVALELRQLALNELNKSVAEETKQMEAAKALAETPKPE